MLRRPKTSYVNLIITTSLDKTLYFSVLSLQEKRFLENKVLEKDLEVYLKVTFRKGIM